MQNCKRCGALLSDTVTTCSICGQLVNKPVKDEEMSKFVSDSQSNKQSNAETSYSYSYSSNRGYFELWMGIVAALCPLVGIVYSCISYAKEQMEVSKKIIIISLISSVLTPFILYFLLLWFDFF